MKRWLVLAGLGVAGLTASAATAHAELFYNTCSPGAFKVCASADVSIVGNTLVFKVWNMSESTYATASIADYNSETGGWHTIRAVGISNIGYTLAAGGSTVVAEYFDGTNWTTLSKWSGDDTDANSIQVYNTGADADNGHAEGIVGCLDPGPTDKNHVSTCGSYPSVPYVRFTISGFTSLDLAGATFEYHGVQAAYANCDPTRTTTSLKNGTTFSDERCTENSFKGSGPPTEVVPEPITMILLGSGLLGVGGAARRRRRAESAARVQADC